MLLVQEDLEQLGILLNVLQATSFDPEVTDSNVVSYSQQVTSGALRRKFKYISECRNNTYDAKYIEETAHISELRDEHMLALEFLATLRAGDSKRVSKFLFQRNTGPGMDVLSRTICLMDATGSMGGLLLKAKNTVKVVYNRLCDILVNNGHSPSVFEMQFAIYRNYNSSREEILEVSAACSGLAGPMSLYVPRTA